MKSSILALLLILASPAVFAASLHCENPGSREPNAFLGVAGYFQYPCHDLENDTWYKFQAFEVGVGFQTEFYEEFDLECANDRFAGNYFGVDGECKFLSDVRGCALASSENSCSFSRLSGSLALGIHAAITKVVIQPIH